MSALALGLDASRAVDTSAYGISGTRPAHAVKPETQGEVGEALRAATAGNLRIVVWGGGVSLPMAPAPARYDVALDVSALRRVVEYDPDDLTLTAECGVTLDALRGEVGPRNQELPLEGSRSNVATLGGVLAANTSGPRRYRFGAPVDRILGARFALGDGTIARTGGKVVKNVSGYAVHRLLCGAHGSLGVMLEASIKLMPRPDRRRVLIYPCAARDLADAVRWAAFPRLDVAALSVVGRELARTLHIATPTPSDFVLVVGFEDVSGWLEQQTAQTVATLGEPVAQIDGDDVNEMWQALADLEEQPAPRLTYTTATRTPGALAGLADAGLADGAVFHAMAGRLHVHVDPREASRVHDILGTSGFERIDHRGVRVEDAAPGLPSLVSLRAALRKQLDPAKRFVAMGPWTTPGNP